MRNKIRKQAFTFVLITTLLFSFSKSNAQYFSEEFDNVTNLTSNGWEMINKSNPAGLTSWFQGYNGLFVPYSNSGYIAANFENTANNGTISNWLISPAVIFHNNDEISFYTRTTDTTEYADRLQVWYSLNGTSNNTGNDEFSTGDFSNSLLDLNSSYQITNYPSGYPFTWTKFTLNIHGLSNPTLGRFAFRYFVEDAGFYGSHSNYIGLDSLNFYFSTTGINDSKSESVISTFPNPVNDFIFLQIPTNFNSSKLNFTLYNSISQSVLTSKENTISSRHKIDVTSLLPGIYFLKISNEDFEQTVKIVKQ